MSTHGTSERPLSDVEVELVAATDLDDEERRRLHQPRWWTAVGLVCSVPVIVVATLFALPVGVVPAGLVLSVGIGLRALIWFAGSGWGRCRQQRVHGGLWAGWGRGVGLMAERSWPGGSGRVRLIALHHSGVVLGEGHWRGHDVMIGWPDIERVRVVFSAGTASAGVQIMERSGRQSTLALLVGDDMVRALIGLGATLRRVRPTAPDPADVARHVGVEVMADPEAEPTFETRREGWLEAAVAMAVVLGPAVAGGALGGFVFGSGRAIGIGVALGLVVGGVLTTTGFHLAERHRFEPGTWTSEGVVSGGLLPPGDSEAVVKWVHVHSGGIDVRAKQRAPDELTIPWADIAEVTVGSSATNPLAQVASFALRQGVTFAFVARRPRGVGAAGDHG
ncbi:MAG: hypothetical protein JJU45_07360, partial [Acidimicrobiia bacterium]|nr:hypothetical protein [Acidimicrobiia bacterium]